MDYRPNRLLGSTLYLVESPPPRGKANDEREQRDAPERVYLWAWIDWFIAQRLSGEFIGG
jgi:hypothetical protein